MNLIACDDANIVQVEEELRITLNRPVVLDDNGVTAAVTTDSPNAILVKSTVVELSPDHLYRGK